MDVLLIFSIFNSTVYMHGFPVSLSQVNKVVLTVTSTYPECTENKEENVFVGDSGATAAGAPWSLKLFPTTLSCGTALGTVGGAG